jgi:hypothetical protein
MLWKGPTNGSSERYRKRIHINETSHDDDQLLLYIFNRNDCVASVDCSRKTDNHATYDKRDRWWINNGAAANHAGRV